MVDNKKLVNLDGLKHNTDLMKDWVKNASGKLNSPVDSSEGAGKFLMYTEAGETTWEDAANVPAADVYEAVEDYFENHPGDAQGLADGNVEWRHLNSAVQDKISRNQTNMAPVEATNVASVRHNTGDYFIYNNTLYQTTENMLAGISSIIPGTNCTVVPDGLSSTIVSMKENFIKAQETQPIEEDNRIWVPTSEQTEVIVPTYDEFSQLKNATGDVREDEETASIGAGTNYAVKGNVGEAISIITSTSSYYYWALSVGDFSALKVTTYNSTSSKYPYYVYFTDSSDVIISQEIPYTLPFGLNTVTVNVPIGATKAYILTQQQGHDSVVVKTYTLVDLQSQIDDINETIENIDIDFESGIGELQDDVSDLQDGVSDLQDDITEINSKIGTVQGGGDETEVSINIGTAHTGVIKNNGSGELIADASKDTYEYYIINNNPGYSKITVKYFDSGSSNYPYYVYFVNTSLDILGNECQPVSGGGWRTSSELNVPTGTASIYLMSKIDGLGRNEVSATGYTSAGWIDLQTQITDLKTTVDNIEQDAVPEIILPAHSYAIVGHQWNLYYENLFRSLPDKYNVKFSFSRANASNQAKYLDDCLRFTPTSASQDLGNHTVTVTLQNRETGETAAEKSFTLTVIADTTLSGKKVIFIGDSLTDADIIPAEIQYNLSGEGITSIGTISNTATIGGQQYSVNDEGRSGWATYDYTRTVENYRTDKTNPFWDGSAFNFGWYIQQNGYSGINAVVIGLGTNGLSHQTEAVAAMDIMIQSIRAYSNDLPILISLITPPATQNGCGNHNGIQCAAEQKRKQLDLVKTYISKYDGKLSNVYVAELYFNLDREHDFPTAEQAASSRNPTLVERQIDNVHPNEYGYLKMADVYYANLLHILS